jgi:hypothetical protein
MVPNSNETAPALAPSTAPIVDEPLELHNFDGIDVGPSEVKYEDLESTLDYGMFHPGGPVLPSAHPSSPPAIHNYSEVSSVEPESGDSEVAPHVRSSVPAASKRRRNRFQVI